MISELSTYSLPDFLMFAPKTYFRLYELYNRAIWPAQVAAAVLSAMVIGLTGRPDRLGGRIVSAMLAASWAVIAWGFFYRYYADINLAAPWFAAGFAVEALLMVAMGVVAGRLRFAWRADLSGRFGLGLLLFVVAIYPFIGFLCGRDWTGAELFGLAPDPTALGTLGLLLMIPGRPHWELMVLPLLWCVVSGLTYLAMDVPVGLITPILALAALAVMMFRGRFWKRAGHSRRSGASPRARV